MFGHLDGFREVLEEQACRCVTAGHDREAVVHALEHCDSSDEWLDATTSMHLLVLDGKIWIRQGRDKSELRGLADLHPGGTSHLYVLYLWKGQFYEAQGMNPAVLDFIGVLELLCRDWMCAALRTHCPFLCTQWAACFCQHACGRTCILILPFCMLYSGKACLDRVSEEKGTVQCGQLWGV